MELTIFFILFFVLLLLRCPVFLSLGIPSLAYLIYIGIPIQQIGMRVVSSINSFTILAALFFVVAGSIMNESGITERIFKFADNTTRHFRGGLAHANIVASVIFSGISGAALADAAGLGAIEIKAMVEKGYDREFSVGITGASSIIGPIIPPSIPAVVFAVTANVSVGQVFAAGIIPGLIMALALSGVVVILAKKRNYPKLPVMGFKEIAKSFLYSAPALLVIVIILGGIFGGIFTPTEAAVVATIYTIIVSIYPYRTFNLKMLGKVLPKSMKTIALVMVIVACSSMFGQVIIREQIAVKLASFMVTTLKSKVLILLSINIFLLFVGMFIEQLSAIILVTPLLIPLGMQIGVTPINMGLIIILNLMVGLLTPPVGLVLYALADVGDISLAGTIRGTMPFLIPLIIALLLITFIPQISNFLPSLIF